MSRYFNVLSESDPKKPKHVTGPSYAKRKKKVHVEKVVDKQPEVFKGPVPLQPGKLQTYQRGRKLNADGIPSKLHRHEIIKADKKFRYSVRQSVRSELLLPEEAGFLEVDDDVDTFRLCQDEISSAVDITSASKCFSLSLTDFGPYKMNYSRDGRYLVLGGQRGHAAAMDWVTKKLLCETNVMESIHDICWLHNPTMFATAQKEWVYIYDTKGVELHCIKQLHRVLQMEFLPYHFLLVTSSDKGFLCWLDVSVGKLIAQTYTSAGRLRILTQNPHNAVVLTGHPNGTVSMWSPNVKDPLVKVFCHQHPVTTIAVDTKGRYMATGSVDKTLKIWDLRTYKCLQQYKLGSAIGFLNFSQQDLLAVGMGNVVEIYRDCCRQTTSAPYIRHKVSDTISDLQFCPYEDVLGICHSRGFSSALIPGAGEPNFDTFESNPFMTRTQRREMEVKALLEKVQPELITLDPSHLGMVNVSTLKEKLEQKKSLLYVKPSNIEFEPRPKTKGKNKSAKKFLRKKTVIEQRKRDVIKELKRGQQEKNEKPNVPKKEVNKSVLDRFKSK